ncbi:MAG TPA: glycosyltransferase, partial [Pirellulaceae bacterium]|nr:glycosyltransferase [Pirellulaceae bacterium]
VVDNNCTDDTREVVQSFKALEAFPCLRLLHEGRQGVGHARRTGLRAARGRLIGFVDDDCLVDSHWIAAALEFADSHCQAGAFGGRNELIWQAPPPDFALAYGESLARQDWGAIEFQLSSAGRRVPCGAGLVLRRTALDAGGWLDVGCLRGRDPDFLGAGEDAEIALRIRNAGWQIWYAPQLRLTHLIPPQRMTLSYVRRLHGGFGRAEVFLRHLAQRRNDSWAARLRGLVWSLTELLAVVRRFWLGYIWYSAERPSWLIRLSYATGCLEGGVRFLLTGKAQ